MILTALGQRHQDSAPDHEGQQQERGTTGESASGETGWRNFAQRSKQTEMRRDRSRYRREVQRINTPIKTTSVRLMVVVRLTHHGCGSRIIAGSHRRLRQIASASLSKDILDPATPAVVHFHINRNTWIVPPDLEPGGPPAAPLW